MASQEKFLFPVKIFLLETGKVLTFSGQFFRQGFRTPHAFGELYRLSFQEGNRSLPMISFVSFVIGVVFTIQSHPTLEDFGATSWLPAIISVSLVREISPMITAILCATTISSRITAELGAMKETEQIDAMEVSGANPFKYLVVPRIFATTLILPILVVYSDIVSLLACFLGVNMRHNEPISFHLFSTQVIDELRYSDIIPSIIKSILFGMTIGIIACYKGYNAGLGAEGVGKSVNSSVVISIFAIFILDLLVAQIADILNFT